QDRVPTVRGDRHEVRGALRVPDPFVIAAAARAGGDHDQAAGEAARPEMTDVDRSALKLVALVVGEGGPADERDAAALEHEDLRRGRPAGCPVEGEEETAGLRGPRRPTREPPPARDDGVP